MIVSILGNDKNLIDKKIQEYKKDGFEDKAFSLLKDFSLLENYFGGLDLFGQKYVVRIYNSLDNPDSIIYLEDKLNMIDNSGNVFIFVNEYNKVSSKIEKISKDFFVYKKEESPLIRPFEFANIIGQRNKKMAWLYIYKNKDILIPEDIIGQTKWKVFSLIEKGDFSVYKKEELTDMLKDLVFLFHNLHEEGGQDIDWIICIEKFILKYLK